jgi:3-dehydroquinate dehydratase-2|tara:strand:- start:1527 stop:1958 length:432 start_codon:yes stop_codon:yes gene_type:complete
MRILVINGPNLNMLGIRQPEIYGNQSLDDINDDLKKYAEKHSIMIECFQSNHEGEIIDMIQQADKEYNGLIINPGALSHYSIAIRDAISSIHNNVVEVHISNIFKREKFRHHSVISEVCSSSVIGFGTEGYKLALNKFITFTE